MWIILRATDSYEVCEQNNVSYVWRYFLTAENVKKLFLRDTICCSVIKFKNIL